MACSRGGGGGGGKRERKKDIWDVEGGYMGVKKQKLLEQFSNQAESEESEGSIFRGVAIFVNGRTNPSSDELKRIMMTHGGVFHHYQNHQTTHIIASNLPDVKVRALKGDEKIVKPEWITESVKAGRLLDYSQYLLYTHQNKHQPRISFKQAEQSSSPEPAPSVEEAVDNGETNESIKWVAKDATDARFLGEFFNNSRLHHIATMGANAKDYVSGLRANHSGEFSARNNLTDVMNTLADGVVSRTIMHIDMDCFFVSVGLVSRPELRGRPVVVTHARGNKQSQGVEQDMINTEARRAELAQYQERLGHTSSKLDNIDGTSSMSEIASCSYEARARGVRNGMFLGPALKLCPDLVPIPYDFAGYERVSRILYDTVASYTLDIMAVSCDEMFVDLTPLCQQLKMDPLQFVSVLRQEIFTKTGCCCSVGLGPNILLARLATKKAKPNGQFMLSEDTAADLLSVMRVSELPGVGRSLESRLSSLSVTTVGDLLSVSLSRLQSEFGVKTGSGLYNMARGKDDRQLEIDHVRKSVSAEVNYGIRFKSWDDAEQFLSQLSSEVSSRLVRLVVTGRQVTLKLMIRAEHAPEQTAKYNGHGVCDNMSRSAQLNTATDSEEVIYRQVINLIKQCNVKPSDLRGIGITVSKLEKSSKTSNNSILKFVKPKNEINETVAASSPSKPSPMKKATPVTAQTIELDPEVLDSLPSDMREEILREYRDRSDVVIKEEAPKTPVKKSDVDQDFLDSLPADIRREVESDLLNQPSSFRQLELTPKKTVIRNIDDDDDDDPNSMDLSYSQVDQDVLSELPPDLQRELSLHFGKNNEPTTSNKIKNESRTAFDAIMTLKQSPDKSSPTKKGKRGRKKGSTNKLKSVSSSSTVVISPQKSVPKLTPVSSVGSIDLEDNDSIDLDVLNSLPNDIRVEVETQMKRNEESNVDTENGCETDTETVEEETETETDEEETETEIETFVEEVVSEVKTDDDDDIKKVEVVEANQPTFCGKSSLEEVRKMLKNWIYTTNSPTDDDLKLLTSYLSDLILDWKIDIVQVLVKCLFRNISNLETSVSCDWRHAWSNIVMKIQAVMIDKYGSTLMIRDKF